MKPYIKITYDSNYSVVRVYLYILGEKIFLKEFEDDEWEEAEKVSASIAKELGILFLEE